MTMRAIQHRSEALAITPRALLTGPVPAMVAR